ncbi:MAG: tryptophan-rich sensory protein [Ornithinimicrobium sp.]
MSSARISDRVRQVTVTAAEVFCVVGTLYGVGVLGTRVEESSGGALAADATRLAPAGPAFSIWSVIYVGLAAYTLWQWLPRQSTREVHRRIGWLAAASMVLNASWLLVTQQGWIWASVGVIAALALVLGVLLRRLTVLGGGVTGDRILIDGTFGLYLGWVAVATCANVTAALVADGVEPRALVSDLIAVAVLVVVACLGFVFAHQLGGRLAVGAAMAWGLSWIAVARLSSDPESVVTAAAAAVTAVLVLLAPVLYRARRRG